jgi:hypothetical protein
MTRDHTDTLHHANESREPRMLWYECGEWDDDTDALCFAGRELRERRHSYEVTRMEDETAEAA